MGRKKRTVSFFLSKAIRHLTARKTVTFAEPISEVYEEGFNAPGFEEYDSTPYDGGFDLTLTFGKPLPPSDSVCYPTSVYDPSSSPSSVLKGFSYASIPSPYGEDKVDLMRKPQNGSPPKNPHKEEQKKGDVMSSEPCSDNLVEDKKNSNGFGDGKVVGSFQGVGSTEKENLQSGFDYQPGFGSGYGREDDNYGRNVPQPPCVDDPGPYGVLASYFPCLSKKDKKTYNKQDGNEQICGIQWRGTEEYLFGNLYPYTERRVDDVSYGYPGYRYERHYPEQPHDVQIEYNENPQYAQVEYNEGSNYVQDDHYEQLWLQTQQYSEIYPVEYNEEPSYVQVEHNEQSWSQNLAYSKAYEDEYYHPFNHDDDSVNSRYFHYN